jgi:serralysin
MTATTRFSTASSFTTTASTATAMASLNTAATIRTLVALDAGLPHLQQLLSGISADAQPLLVPPGADAIALITAALQASGATRLALVAHGAPGQVLLGAGGLDAAVLAARGAELSLSLIHI